ncbi:MAG: hypothetical protein GXO25_04330, partial [Euryarchaeota archaeon]|nr:hypothetical protein [Euryarchaeota archaeon]
MGIYKISNEFFYGYASKKRYADVRPYEIVVSSKIWDRVDMLRGKGFKCEGYREYDPEGDEIIDCWKIIPYDEYEEIDIPRNYPGYYYWVWYNGAFFKVLGETEKYVLVDVDGWNFEQADALGI